MGVLGDPEAAKPMDLEGQCGPGALPVFCDQTGDHMSAPHVTQDPGTLHYPGGLRKD